LKRTRTLQIALILILFNLTCANAQMITGVWKGKINKQKTELKIIQNGDSLIGASYYYESVDHYRRYSIKGYFDPATNEAVWWDDQLIEEKSGKLNISIPGKIPLLSRADFNCPGGSKMMLDGKAAKKENDAEIKGDIHLDKSDSHMFDDEWDFVIDNYTTGANNPDIIDSVSKFAEQSVKTVQDENPVVITQPTIIEKQEQKITTTKEEQKPVIKIAEQVKPAPTIEEKFVSRKKVLTTEIPLSGDSIELRFYDNAEIDGDSISLFLNNQLIFQHIRLLGTAYIIKLAVSELKETNELIMVAENLGSIPPNTSYMVAIVGDKRYEARLESTEGSSAMVRFVKAPPNLP
jgi:hypothetical protein